jgi:hypothetical protein
MITDYLPLVAAQDMMQQLNMKHCCAENAENDLGSGLVKGQEKREEGTVVPRRTKDL